MNNITKADLLKKINSYYIFIGTSIEEFAEMKFTEWHVKQLGEIKLAKAKVWQQQCKELI